MLTEYYTAMGKKPVLGIIKNSSTGAATNIISGLSFEGDTSNLYDTLENALIGQESSAISGISNTSEITSVRDYLYSSSLLRIDDLKTRYKNENMIRNEKRTDAGC